MANRNLGDQRRDYIAKPLRRADLAENPFDQFSRWYSDAENHCVGYPNPMILSTASESGQPSSRVVLLKSFDEQGFVFYTNYESDKGQQIARNAQVSLLFFWEALERQVNILGVAEKYSSVAADEYFASRPRRSQISACASDQSRPIESREALQKRFEKINQMHAGKTIPKPSSWGGYIVKPSSIEFWQGQPDRLHDRLKYVSNSNRDNQSWSVERLSP